MVVQSRAENGVRVGVGRGAGGRGHGAWPGQVSSSSRPAENLES